MNRSGLIATIVVLGVIVGAIAILAGGPGDAEVSTGDASGDVQVDDGPKPPRQLARADIERAVVSRTAEGVVFEAQMASSIPREFATGSLEWRWEIYEAGDLGWIVVANVNQGPSASVVATRTDYSATTLDDSLPGTVEVDGDTIRVRLDPAEIEGFPSSFEWFLLVTLDGDRIEARSAQASDRAPMRDRLQLGG